MVRKLFKERLKRPANAGFFLIYQHLISCLIFHPASRPSKQFDPQQISFAIIFFFVIMPAVLGG